MDPRRTQLEQLLATLTVLAVGPLGVGGCEREAATTTPADPNVEHTPPAVVAPELESLEVPEVIEEHPAEGSCEAEVACSGEGACGGEASCGEGSCAG